MEGTYQTCPEVNSILCPWTCRNYWPLVADPLWASYKREFFSFLQIIWNNFVVFKDGGVTWEKEDSLRESTIWNCLQGKLPGFLLPNRSPKIRCEPGILGWVGLTDDSTSFCPQSFSWVIRSCRQSKSLSQVSHRYTSTHLEVERLDWGK